MKMELLKTQWESEVIQQESDKRNWRIEEWFEKGKERMTGFIQEVMMNFINY